MGVTKGRTFGFKGEWKLPSENVDKFRNDKIVRGKDMTCDMSRLKFNFNIKAVDFHNGTTMPVLEYRYGIAIGNFKNGDSAIKFPTTENGKLVVTYERLDKSNRFKEKLDAHIQEYNRPKDNQPRKPFTWEFTLVRNENYGKSNVTDITGR